MRLFFPFNKSNKDIPLPKWIWLSYVRTALVPLLLVELALIAIYLFSHTWSRQENIATIESDAKASILRQVKTHSNNIEQRLTTVAELTELLRQETQVAMSRPAEKDLDDPQRYKMHEGMLYSDSNDGKPAVFFSGFVPIDDSKKRKVAQTSRIDKTLQRIVEINPLVVQAYFNTYDSLNRIWPYFDVLSQYAKHMNIPTFNFYYEADATHNPERKTKWIDAYLDPAGQGWMISCIAPVYNHDFLEGVVGLDITLDKIINEVISLQLPWNAFAVLINTDGVLLALPKQAEPVFGIKELTSHSYSAAISKETFKPDTFNIFLRKDLNMLVKAIISSEKNVTHYVANEPYILASKILPSTGWRLVIFAPENEIFAPANALAKRLTQIGWLLLGALVIFYIIYFAFLYRRAKRLSSFISEPLIGIQNMAIQIGQGNFNPEAPNYRVTEFKSTVEQMQHTARMIERAEAQLIREKGKAEQANYAKGAFLANMSHEIRTPLNAITGISELAQDGLTDEKVKKYLQQIQASAQSLVGIVNDILDFSKIESGSIQIVKEPFELESILYEVVNLFYCSLEHRPVELFVDLDQSLPTLLVGDAQRIRQILTNLIGNAIKFTEQGEVVVKIAMQIKREDEYIIRFSVQDTGIGIAEKVLPTIFQSFTQADDSISRQYGGTGLGLAISEQLITLMGGGISVTSVLGKGSKFEFSLPCKREPVQSQTTLTPKQLPDSNVLLITQHSSESRILNSYLQAWGANVTEVGSIPLATELMQFAATAKQPFDYVLVSTDCITSADLSPSAEANARSPAQPGEIILLCQRNFDDTQELQLFNQRIKPHCLLKKPITPLRLFDTLRNSKLNPTTPNASNDKAQELHEIGAPIKNHKILLVEDVRVNQQIASEFLHKAGLQVVIAENGAVAVELAQHMPFDAILMDVQMPLMDGFEATMRIRALPNSNNNIPIIAMTAAALEHERSACINAGMNDHIAKPLNSKKMIQTLVYWIKNQHNPSPVTAPELAFNTPASEPENALPALPGFDFTEISVLINGDVSKLKEILNMFSEDFRGIPDEIANYLNSGAYDKAERCLHQMKGVAGNVGAQQLYSISQELDSQLKQATYAPETWELWCTTFHATLQDIDTFIGRNHS